MEEQVLNSNSKKPSLKKLFMLLPLVVLIAVAGSGYFLASRQKAELESLSQKQVDNLKNLKSSYAKIVDVIQNKDKQEEVEPATKLLGVQTQVQDLPKAPEQYLLEDSPEVKESRKLQELYKDSLKLVEEVEKDSQALKDKARQLPASLIYRPDSQLMEQTSEFVSKSKALLTYLQETTKLEIKAFTYGFDIGMAINKAITLNLSDQSLDDLEEEIQRLTDLKQEYEKLDISGLSDDLKQEHQDSLDSFEEDTAIFTDILTAFQSKNVTRILDSLQSLSFEAVSATEKGRVEQVDFWQQDPTINEVDQLIESWQEFSKNLKTKPF